MLTGSGELVKSELARVTKAVAIDNLTAIASSLSVIKKDLWEIKNTTLQLQEQTSNLRSGQSECLTLPWNTQTINYVCVYLFPE